MLVDINLLPRKEIRSKKKRNYYLILAIGTLLLIGGMMIISMSIDKKNKEIQGQSNKLQALITTEQEMLTTYQTSDSVVQLEQAVRWAKEYPIKVVPVIRELTSLLPERGFFISFLYDENEAIEIEVQFDASREAAYYLKSLLDSEWVMDASLLSLQRNSVQTNVDEGATSTEMTVQRFTGTFQITLNKDKIKEDENQGEANEQQGGADS